MPATKTRKRSKKNGSSQAIYQQVTDRIIEALEAGTVPWQRPWKSKRLPGVNHQNLASKKSYRGINPFLLDIEAMINGYDLPYWVTFKQAKDLGGHVRKDEKSTVVVFNKKLVYEDKNDLDENGKPKKKPFWMLRHYNVFNVAQCDGLEEKIPALPEEEPEDEFTPIERCEQIGSEMKNPPSLDHGGSRAFYRPSTHAVRLPKPEQFNSPEHYYSTKFHEFTHATGNEKCLGRVKDWTSFGSDPYAKEELVAEMGAAMLDRVAGIDAPTQKNSANYIANWLQRFQGDPKLVVQAASQAQRAADYILGVEFSNAE